MGLLDQLYGGLPNQDNPQAQLTLADVIGANQPQEPPPGVNRSPAGVQIVPYDLNKINQVNTTSVAKPSWMDSLDLAGGVDEKGRIKPGFLQSAQMLKNASETYQGQLAGVNTMEKHLAEERTKPQPTNLYPFAALADMMATNPKFSTAEMYKQSGLMPASPEERTKLIRSMEENLQKARGALSQNDVKQLALLIGKPGMQTATETVTKEAGHKPIRDTTTNRELDKYKQETDDVMSMLDRINAIKELMPKVKDWTEQSTGEKASTLALGGVNAALGTNYALSENQRAYQQLQKEVGLLKEVGLVGKRSTDKMIARIGRQVGALDASSKDQFVQAINGIRQDLLRKAQSAAAAHPEAAATFAANPNLASPQKIQATPPLKVMPFGGGFAPKDTSKMTLEEKKAYLKELQNK